MKVNSSPSVALLIPCFNGIQYLPRLMENIAQVDQGFSEIIVYDDASTESFPFNPVSEFPEIKFIQGKVNHGSGYARNRLMEVATADYLHFHDIDDTDIPSNFLTELLPYLTPNTAVFSSWKIEYLDNKPPKLYDYEKFNEIDDFTEYFVRHHVHLNASIFPRTAALNVKFDEDFRIFQDLVFNIRLANSGVTYKHIGTVITTHQKNSKSTLSRVKQSDFALQRARYCQRCLDILPQRYSPIIGEIALYYAWDAYLNGFDKESEVILSVAKKCGKLNYQQFGKTVELIAPWLGLRNAFKLRRWWFNKQATA